MRHLLLLLSVSAAVLLAACEALPSGAGDPEHVTYDPSLSVDLTQMARSSTGLYTQDLMVGTGAEATVGKTVLVHYTGWLPDGTEVDTSRDSAEPFFFELGKGEVIAGWDEGVQGMKVGGKRKLVVPSSLGYGSRQTGSIPPNSVLVFDVELVGVQ